MNICPAFYYVGSIACSGLFQVILNDIVDRHQTVNNCRFTKMPGPVHLIELPKG
jgi:hypothetical protein